MALLTGNVKNVPGRLSSRRSGQRCSTRDQKKLWPNLISVFILRKIWFKLLLQKPRNRNSWKSPLVLFRLLLICLMIALNLLILFLMSRMILVITLVTQPNSKRNFRPMITASINGRLRFKFQIQKLLGRPALSALVWPIPAQDVQGKPVAGTVTTLATQDQSACPVPSPAGYGGPNPVLRAANPL